MAAAARLAVNKNALRHKKLFSRDAALGTLRGWAPGRRGKNCGKQKRSSTEEIV